MKNIHILPTDKPSRLVLSPQNKDLTREFKLNPSKIDIGGGVVNYNLYITSDEEIEESDWVIQVNFEKTNTQLIQCVTESQVKIANNKNGSFTKKKIILTTDLDLIKDGVQAIDNEFLEWFIKNPNCECVEVVKGFTDITNYGYNFLDYKIIIPKEKPKQDWFCPKCNTYVSSECVTFEETHQICNTGVVIKKSKQETLEKAAESYSKRNSAFVFQENHKIDFIAGAKWQAERMYSKEEVEKAYIDAYHKGYNVGQKDAELHPLALTIANNVHKDKEKWFNQFKKK